MKLTMLLCAVLALALTGVLSYHEGKRSADKWWKARPPQYAPTPEHFVKGIAFIGNCNLALVPSLYFLNDSFEYEKDTACQITPTSRHQELRK